MTIFERVRAFNLPNGKYCVIGSRILEALGIRSSGYLDILVTEDLFESLKETRGLVEDAGFLKKYARRTLKEEDAEYYMDFYAGGYYFDPRDVMERATVIEELPFLPLQELLACKKELCAEANPREKDLQDVELIEKYLNEKS